MMTSHKHTGDVTTLKTSAFNLTLPLCTMALCPQFPPLCFKAPNCWLRMPRLHRRETASTPTPSELQHVPSTLDQDNASSSSSSGNESGVPLEAWLVPVIIAVLLAAVAVSVWRFWCSGGSSVQHKGLKKMTYSSNATTPTAASSSASSNDGKHGTCERCRALEAQLRLQRQGQQNVGRNLF